MTEDTKREIEEMQQAGFEIPTRHNWLAIPQPLPEDRTHVVIEWSVRGLEPMFAGSADACQAWVNGALRAYGTWHGDGITVHPGLKTWAVTPSERLFGAAEILYVIAPIARTE